MYTILHAKAKIKFNIDEGKAAWFLTLSERLESLEEDLKAEGRQEGSLGVVSYHIDHVYLRHFSLQIFPLIL